MFIYQCHDVIRGGLRLSPATFTCESPCVVPTVANAAGGGVCKEAPWAHALIVYWDHLRNILMGGTMWHIIITHPWYWLMWYDDIFWHIVTYYYIILLRHIMSYYYYVYCLLCLCHIASHAKLLKRMLNALGRRKAGEGEKILPFTSCTTQCAAGYTQSVRYLTLGRSWARVAWCCLHI